MLAQGIESKSVSVAVLGLGHVGYPMASLFAKNGFRTIGYDINSERLSDIIHMKVVSEIDSLLSNDELERQKELSKIEKNLILSNKEEILKNADIFIVDVPTPLKEDDVPNLEFLEDTCKKIAKFLRKDCLVIIESTIYPGATEEIVNPILNDSGLSAGIDFYLCFSPERIDPGNIEWSLESIPKIVGGINKKSADLANLLYSQIITKVVQVSSLKVAESVKMLENVFRSVNIALINELSKFFEKFGIDAWETIDAAASKPFGFLPHYPGPGVGGHCIPKDPLYLLYKARKLGLHIEFIEEAAIINRNMPLHIISIIDNIIKILGKNLQNSSFAILGVTYKKDVLDIRNTPAKLIITELNMISKNVAVFDPLTSENFGAKTGNLDETIKDKDCIILLVDHSYFKDVSIEDKINKLSPNCCLIDTRNFIDVKKLKKTVYYKCLGKP